MKKMALQLAIGLLIISNGAFAQWGGSTTTSGDTYRDGNVGIGTTAPTRPLDVVGSIRTTGSLEIDGGDLYLSRLNNDFGYIVRPDITGKRNLVFAVTGAGLLDYVNVNSRVSHFSGNVGIGTSSPIRPLDVIGSIRTTGSLEIDGGDLYLSRTNNDFGYIVRPDIDGKRNLVFAVTGAGLLDYVNVNSKLSYFTGNVGIGTSAVGSFKLAVEGKIGAREIQVTLSNPFPDYVFGNNYKLRSLASLENYINQYKHLPNVPSAEEVEKKGGIELGQLSTKLLEKIEELTLYVIELKKENEQIKKEIEKLSQKK